MAEVDFIRAEMLEKKEWGKRLSLIQGTIRRHQAMFGDVPRQCALYASAAGIFWGHRGLGEPDAATSERAIQPFIAFADKVLDRDQQILSRSMLLLVQLRAPERKAAAIETAKALAPLIETANEPGKPVRGRFDGAHFTMIARAEDGAKRLLFDTGLSKVDPDREKFYRDIEGDGGWFERDFASDGPGYMYALKIRQADEPEFLRVMKKLGEKALRLNVRNCTKTMTPELCAIRVGRNFNDIGQAPLAWEYARIAKAYVDSTKGLDRNDVAMVYIELAAHERRAGFAGKATDLERQAKEIIANGQPAAAAPAPSAAAAPAPASATPAASVYEQLQHLKATAGITIALKEAAIRAPSWNSAAKDWQGDDPGRQAMAFMIAHVENLYSVPLASEQKAFEAKIYAAVADRNQMVESLLFQDAPHVPPPLLKAVADDIRRRAGNTLDRFYPDRGVYFRERMYAFCYKFTMNCDQDLQSRLVRASDPAARSAAFKALVNNKYIEGMGVLENGDVAGFLGSLALGFDLAKLTGDRWLARAFAEEYIEQGHTLATKFSGADWNEIAQQQIETLLPMYVWLSGNAIAQGQRPVALKYLADAEQHVKARLAREWRSGGTQAAQTLVALRPSLRELADQRAALVATAAPADMNRAGELALSAMQYPQIAEIALDIIAKSQQRRASIPDLEKALASRENLAAELARIDMLAKSKIASPADQVAAKARINDQIRALDAKISGSLPGAADAATLQPLPAAALASLLKPGEALLTSVVTAQRTSFALLSGSELLVWQVPLGRREIERRVAELRKGIDFTKTDDYGAFPLSAAHALFNDLFGPAKAKLLAAKAILYAPDGPLLALPPQLLLTEPPASVPKTGMDYRAAKLSWLVYGPAFSIVPSLRAIEALRRAPLS